MSLPATLKNEVARVARAAEKVMETTRDWQLIRDYMNNRLREIDLTQKQHEKKERYQYIYNQRVSGKYTDADIVNQVQKFFGIESTQAYEDMRCSTEIFTSVINIDKMFDLKLKLEINKSYQRKCLELGDMKSLAKFEKNGIEIAKLLEDAEDNRGELFQGHILEVTFDPTLLGATPISKDEMKDLLDQINQKRGKKIRTDMFDEIEEVQDDD